MINFGDLPRLVHCHSATHDPRYWAFQRFRDKRERVKTTVGDEAEVRKVAGKGMNPGVVKRWDGPVFFRVQPLKMALSRMHDKLVDAALLADHSNEVNYMFPLVVVVHAESTLYRHRYVYLADHFCGYLGHSLRV